MVDLSRVRMGGALAPLAEGFRIALEADGYTPHGAVKQLHLFAHLSRWLEAERLDVADLDRESVERFFRDRRELGHRLPLPADVGDAIVTYLQHGRPADALGRTVFVRVRARHIEPSPVRASEST
jgi:hypothetical protein